MKIKIFTPKEYNLPKFKFINYNRETDKKHVFKLKQSIEKIGQQKHIDVYEKDNFYYVFDGQHRFKAIQQLGINMVVGISDDEKGIDILHEINNTQKKWNTLDEIVSRSKHYDSSYYRHYIKLVDKIYIWNGSQGHEIKPNIKAERMIKLIGNKFPKFSITAIIDAYKPNTSIGYKTLILDNKYFFDENSENFGDRILNNCFNAFNITNNKAWLKTITVRALKIVMLNNKKRFNDNHFLKKAGSTKLQSYNEVKAVADEIKNIYNWNSQKNKLR